jgi:hypothetical protein
MAWFLMKPSIATKFQRSTLIFYFSLTTCFGPYRPSSGEIYNWCSQGLFLPQRIHLSVGLNTCHKTLYIKVAETRTLGVVGLVYKLYKYKNTIKNIKCKMYKGQFEHISATLILRKIGLVSYVQFISLLWSYVPLFAIASILIYWTEIPSSYTNAYSLYLKTNNNDVINKWTKKRSN